MTHYIKGVVGPHLTAYGCMARPASRALAGTTVVDTDVHSTVEEDAPAPYLEEPYRPSTTESPSPTVPSSSRDQRLTGRSAR